MMIKKKYLKRGDILVLEDNTRYWLNSNVAIKKFSDDNKKVVKVIRQISITSPYFIGFIEDKGQTKLAFWINTKSKYATTKYKKNKNNKKGYTVIIWERK